MTVSSYISSLRGMAKEGIAHAGFQKYLKSAGWLFFARFITLAISFLGNIIIVRYLGPTNNGLLSYAVSFVGLFSFIASLGLDTIVYRDLIKQPERSGEILGTAFILKVISSFVAIGLIAVAAFHFESDNLIRSIIIINSLGFAFSPFLVIGYLFQAKVLSKYVSIVSIIGTCCLVFLKLLAVFLERGVVYFSIILMLENFFYASLWLYFYKKHGGATIAWKFSAIEGGSMLKSSWPLMLSTVFTTIYSRIDQVMIENLIGPMAVGLYNAAAALSEVWYFIPALITTSLFPAIVNARAADPVIYRKRLVMLYSLMMYLGVAVALPVSLFSKLIIWIVYGNAFISSASVLDIYVWGGVSVFIGIALSNYFISENQTRPIFVSTCLGALINVALNLVLIPRLGMIGGAISTLISYSLIPFIAIAMAPQRREKIAMFGEAIVLPFISLSKLWNKKS